MAEGMSSTLADACLSLQVDAYTWVQLHIGAPGAAGTTNPAVETDRMQATWGAPGAGTGVREIASTADVEWTSVAGSEDYTHFTSWDVSSAGVFGFSGSVTANAVTAGDTFTIPAGSLTASFPIAS